MNKKIILKTDGTLNGILTAVFEVFSKNLQNYNNILYCCKTYYNQNFLEQVIEVETDEDKSKRVLKKLKTLLKSGNYAKLFIAVKSGNENMPNIVFFYILENILNSDDQTDNLRNQKVFLYDKLVRAVLLEAHRFKGFLRFSKLNNGVYYAKYFPDNDITAIISPHFVKRYYNMPFIIHDTHYNQICAHYKNKTIIVNKEISEIKVKDEISNLFKSYCDSITIKSRENKKLMHNYMPKRYFINAPEKNELLNI